MLPPKPSSSSSSDACVPPTNHRKILVVDDNVDAADMLGLILSSRGHEVEIAYNGEQALDVAESFHPDVVCLDIGLPGLDGYEVARRLRQLPSQNKRLLLIALTGYGQAEDRRLTTEAGFDDHLVKPATTDAIEAALARYGEAN